MHQSPCKKSCHAWIELNYFVEVLQCTPRLTNLHPPKMAIKISMRVCWVLIKPFIHHPQIALRIGAKNFMYCKRLLGRSGLFNTCFLFLAIHVEGRGGPDFERVR